MPVFTPDTVRTELQDIPGHPCGPARMLRYSDSGGLTQFGAFVEILSPGSRSSLCHWHEREDEMVYMLEGQVTLWEGGTARQLNPGEAATFRAGDPAGHYLQNDGTAEARYLVIGTRAGADRITYPDHDRIIDYDDRAGVETITTLDGRPAAESPYYLPGA
jgi:uncharacterized cupin superfamily protein